MRNKTGIIGAAILAATFAGVSAQAATYNWDGGGLDGIWTNALNWDLDITPTSADRAYIDNGDTVTYQDGFTNVVNRQLIRGGSTLNVTGGDFNASASSSSAYDLVGGTSGHSYLNVSDGSYSVGHGMRIGAGATGTVNLSGGLLNIYRNSNSIDGSNPRTSVQLNSLGTLNITNGTLNTRGGVEVAGGGVFHVYGGYSPEIALGGSSDHVSDGDWFQASNGVLKVGISTNGLTPIVLENNTEDGEPIVNIAFGAILDVSFVDGAMETNSWPVIDASSGIAFNNLGLVFADGVDTNDWGYITSNNVLYVGYGLGWPVGGDVVGPPAAGRTLYWTGAGGDSDSSNPTNWVLDTAATVPATWGPYDMDLWRIAHSDVTGIEQGTNYVVDYDATAADNNQADIDVGDGSQGTFNYNSGNLSFGVSGSRQEFGVNANGDGTLNMNGGDLNLNTARFGVNGGTGTLNLNAGTLNIGRGYNDASIWVGGTSGSDGTVSVTGGRVFTRTAVIVGGNGSVGTFSVEGSEASLINIGGNSDLDGAWYQYEGGTLKSRIDEGGITTISLLNKDAATGGQDGNAYFYAGSQLDLGWMPGVTNFGTFDIMTWDGELMTNGLVLADSVDTNVWSFAIVDANSDGTNDTLRATAGGNTANGTPYSWLIGYGLTGADDDVDNDGDGLLTWQEYVAGTVPTNSASVLKVTGAEGIVGGDFVITWQSVEDRSYSIITNLDLIYGVEGTAVSGISGQPVETSYTSSVPAASAMFYQIGVTNN
jgi:hypothetical protein